MIQQSVPRNPDSIPNEPFLLNPPSPPSTALPTSKFLAFEAFVMTKKKSTTKIHMTTHIAIRIFNRHFLPKHENTRLNRSA